MGKMSSSSRPSTYSGTWGPGTFVTVRLKSRVEKLIRAADAARPGGADQFLHPALQPHGDERPRPPGPAVRTRPGAGGHLPHRLPAAESGAVRGDHELQRGRQ